MNGHLLHGGQDNQQVSIQLFRHDRCGKILVNHGRGAFQVMSVRLKNRDPAPAAGYDDMIGLYQGADRVDLNNPLWFRAGHHPAPAPPGVLHHMVIPFLFHVTGFLLGHERADRLGGIQEGGVLRIHFHLGQHRGGAFLDSPVQQFLPHGVLQVVTDITLAHRHAD